MSCKVIEHPTFGTFQLMQQIGVGGFSSVFRYRNKECHYDIALKKFDNFQGVEKALESAKQEFEILNTISHPLIPQAYDYFPKEENWYLVEEYIHGETLQNLLMNQGAILECEAQKIFFQLATCLAYLHENHICHRDFKCNNIIIDHGGNAHLIDFGFSQVLTSNNVSNLERFGSPAYCAPEIVKGEPLTEAIDNWSLGIVLYAMLTGTLPFAASSIEMTFKQIVETEPSYFKISGESVDLIKHLLCKNPSERWTPPKCLHHPWLLKVGNSLLHHIPEEPADLSSLVSRHFEKYHVRPTSGPVQNIVRRFLFDREMSPSIKSLRGSVRRNQSFSNKKRLPMRRLTKPPMSFGLF